MQRTINISYRHHFESNACRISFIKTSSINGRDR
jgi:hypothetical protein